MGDWKKNPTKWKSMHFYCIIYLLSFRNNTALITSLGCLASRKKHTLPDLPYDYGALQPHISAEIMQLHHSKHHAAYVNNLNIAEEKYKEALAKGTGNNISLYIFLVLFLLKLTLYDCSMYICFSCAKSNNYSRWKLSSLDCQWVKLSHKLFWIFRGKHGI